MNETNTEEQEAHMGTLADLVPAPAELTESLPRDSYEQYISTCSFLLENMADSQWAIGDLMVRLERDLGTKKGRNNLTPMEQLARDLNYAPSSLRIYKWVSASFPNREERDKTLTWSHFRRLASLDPGERRAWARKAADEGWSVEKLSHELQGIQDSKDATEGKPCSTCGGALPLEWPYTLRHGKDKQIFCCIKCALTFMFTEYQKTDEAKAEEAAAA